MDQRGGHLRHVVGVAFFDDEIGGVLGGEVLELLGAAQQGETGLAGGEGGEEGGVAAAGGGAEEGDGLGGGHGEGGGDCCLMGKVVNDGVVVLDVSVVRVTVL